MQAACSLALRHLSASFPRSYPQLLWMKIFAWRSLFFVVLQVFILSVKGVECAHFQSLTAFMKSRTPPKAPSANLPQQLPLKVALWLLDQPQLGRTHTVKRLAGSMLKAPARRGVVQAQSRLGQLLYSDCDNLRDRRMGLELLRQAARAGDSNAAKLTAEIADKPLRRHF